MAEKIIRNRSVINSTLNKNVHAEIRKLSEESGVPISKLLDRAIELLLEEYKDKIKLNSND